MEAHKLLQRMLCVALFLTVLCPAALSQKKVTIFLKHQGDDAVGNQIAFEIREALRRSSGYSLVSEQDASTVVEMVTAEIVPTGAQSVVSLVIVKKGELPFCNFNLGHSVYSIGSQRVKEMAADMVADVDKQVSEFSFLYK